MTEQCNATRLASAPALTQSEIDQRVFDLYDEYCHGCLDRREFLQRAGALTIGGVSALAMAEALLPRYALAQTISFTDQRIKARYVSYPSPGGNSAIGGYLVQPNGPGPFPAVLVIHENRGLNPTSRTWPDASRPTGSLLSLPTACHRSAGIRQRRRRPHATGRARPGQAAHGHGQRRAIREIARAVRRQARRDGLLLGGSTTNFLAVTLGADLQAGVPFYGAAAETAAVPAIKAPLLIHYAESDERINALWPGYEAALKAAGVQYEMHTYPGTQHGFHNNSTPRYREPSAKLARERTIGFFKKHLA